VPHAIELGVAALFKGGIYRRKEDVPMSRSAEATRQARCELRESDYLQTELLIARGR
jgi:hypothetical protein